MNQTLQLLRVKGKRGLSLHQGTAHTGRVAAVVTGLLLLTACAAAPLAPSAQMQAAEQAIATAERERVVEYASAELDQARKKLTAARSAVQDEKMDRAKRLAEEARVDAELASAKAEVAKAREVNEEMKKSLDTLKQEMHRSTGDRP